ncbi:MAG: hypothetical protein HDT02_00815 [Bacteroidales bacterium]|nr:hypothetical protein [Bacteroidales bacterium]
MNKFLFPLLLLLVSLTPASALYTSSYNFTFLPESSLKEGRWVKIEVDESGVYEIPYTRLREMGFSNPERVGVFGNGGHELNISFYSGTKSPLYRDDLQPVGVCHAADRLYFYAVGPENLTFDGSKFVRTSLNIYSRTGVYFLSDANAYSEILTENPGDGDTVVRDDLWGYLYHERDLIHGEKNYGRYYWGEDFTGGASYSFPLRPPFMATSSSSPYGRLDFTLIHSGKDDGGSMKIGVAGRNDSIATSKDGKKAYSYYIRNLQTSLLDGTDLTFEYSGGTAPYIGLDYWILTYPKVLPAIAGGDFRQELLSFHNASFDESRGALNVPEGSVVFDVTDPYQPVRWPVEGNLAYFPRPSEARTVVVFDSSKPQKQIHDNYTPVGNSNLHSYGKEGCDLLIITIRAMLPYAERIAELHRRYDGLKVIVAEREAVHNEFSAGMPDPMAYRAFAKMLYQSPGRKCSNVLFIGPFRDDLRGVGVATDSGETFAAFPALIESFSSTEDDAPSVIDFAGYASDSFESTNRMEVSRLDMGVGVLPIHTSYQGELAVAKIEEYLQMLESGDPAAIVNRTLGLGCPGQNHAHAKQTLSYASFLQAYAKATAGGEFPHSNILVADYEQEDAGAELRRALEEGIIYSIYYGHAGASGMYERFWQTQDFINLRNRYLGFMFMAGCLLSPIDLGQTGIGDLCVTDSPRGLIGAVVSTRKVWSQQNETLAKEFLKAMFLDSSGRPRTSSPTVGEVYATAKTGTENNNELCFYYVGDPALRMPIALRSASVSIDKDAVVEGDIVTISGNVMIPAGTRTDTAVNGKVVVRICRPTSLHFSEELIGNGVYDYLPVEDTGIEIVSAMGDVVDGRFSVPILLPQDVADFRPLPGDTDSPLKVYVGVYEPTRRNAFAGSADLQMLPLGAVAAEKPEVDTEAPEVEVKYDEVSGKLLLSASDNVGFSPLYGVGINARLDGEPFVRNEDAGGAVGYVSDWSDACVMLNLPEGDHRFEMTVRDSSGNLSPKAVCEFTVGRAPLLTLDIVSYVALDEVRFDVSGAGPASGLELRVTDAGGLTVFSGPADASQIVCSTEGWTPGIYSAAIVEAGESGARRHSRKVSFSVVK